MKTINQTNKQFRAPIYTAIATLLALISGCSSNISLNDEDVTAVIAGTDLELETQEDGTISAYYKASGTDLYRIQSLNQMGEPVGSPIDTSFRPAQGSDASLRSSDLWHDVHRYPDDDQPTANARHAADEAGSLIFGYAYDNSTPLWTVALEIGTHCHRTASDDSGNLYCWIDTELLQISREGVLSTTGNHGVAVSEEPTNGEAYFIAGNFVFFDTTTDSNNVENTIWTVFTPNSGLPARTELFASSSGDGVLSVPTVMSAVALTSDNNALFLQSSSEGDSIVTRINMETGLRTHTRRFASTSQSSTTTLSILGDILDVDINDKVVTLNTVDLTSTLATDIRGDLLHSTNDYIFTGKEAGSSTNIRRFDRGYIAPTPETDSGASESKPTNLRVEIYSSTAFELFWDIPADASCPCQHLISLDGVDQGTIDGTSFFQENMSPGTYTFDVRRIDSNGLVSEAATIAVTLSTDSGLTPVSDPTDPIQPTDNPPATPTTVAAPANVSYTFYSANTLDIFWENPNPASVSSFEIYRNGTLVDTSTGNSYFVSGLDLDTDYEFGIVAIDANGTRSEASTVSFRTQAETSDNPPSTDPQTPPTSEGSVIDAPRNLQYTALSDSSIELTWDQPHAVNGIQAYEVFRNGLSYASVSDARYIELGMDPSAEYTYTIVAIDWQKNRSSMSESIGVRIADMRPDAVTNGNDSETPQPGTSEDPLHGTGSPPNAPRNLRTTVHSYNSIELNWDHAIDPDGGSIQAYEIFRNGLSYDSVSGTSYIETGMDPNAEYTYTVVAVDWQKNRSSVSESAVIRINDVWTDPGTTDPLHGTGSPPNAPRNLHIAARTQDSIELSWDEAIDPDGGSIQAYEIFRNGLSYASVSGTSYIETGMDPNANYTYTVVAVDWQKNRSAVSESAVIKINDVWTNADTDPLHGTGSAPNAPRNLRITVHSYNSIELNWNDAIDPDGGSIQAYEIFRNGLSYASVSGTSYVEFGMDPTAEYTYTIVAVDWQKNRSAVSASAVVTTGQHFAY